ncbi:condensation protein [Streptomyces sp. NRRL F-4711]|uniref:wax ester/triacylglycerol synthase domain-containing protein n=1 Tax=unclassified Streptomyces TaxID=2593676 RepID=UPI0004C26CB4|nr:MULTISPECIES: wax ester/triacylglycerol synthase domain-containing protein [unclassified Streptomyces]KOT98244.1 condensation protein [Streptomyces sp. NRRL F-4711]
MLRLGLGKDGRLPPSVTMGTVDVAFHLAARGGPLPVVFAFAFDGGPPTLDSVRTRVAERAHGIPALHYRIARESRRFRRVDRIAVDRHVHEAWLPEDTDGSATGRLMLSRPVGADGRPPWEVWLVHGPAGRHTLCYRTDHAFQDGVGAAYTARALLGDDPTGGPAPRPRRLPTAAGIAATLGDVAGAFGASTAKPAFDGVCTGRVDVCHADTPLARLRALGRAHGATVTDVYLAALSHAVRTWHLKETGAVHPPLPVAIPMSVRAPGEEQAPGNRMITARILLPCDEESPQRALARVKEAMNGLRAARRRDSMRVLLAATPRSAGARIGVRLVHGRRVAGPVSSVDFGPALVHQGLTARRAAVYTSVASGIRSVVTLTSQHDTACLTVVHDEALRTADELPDLWLAALLELERG